jgi:hypothetical protein
MHEEYRKEQDEKAANEERERRERLEKADAKLAWLAEGGAEADFEREWPKIRHEGRRRRIFDATRDARNRQRASGISRI